MQNPLPPKQSTPISQPDKLASLSRRASLEQLSKQSSNPPHDLDHSMRQATLKLDVIVVGAGIAGLACAYALGKIGHKVRVLDEEHGPVTRESGVRLPPNLTKILMEWGLEDELRSLQKCRKTVFHSLETGELMGYFEWREDVLHETGADFLLAHYDDLYQMMYRLALSVNTEVFFNSHISSVSVDEDTQMPTVVLMNGKVLQTDLLVGADGSGSIVREFVTGESDEPEETGHSFHTVVLPLDAVAEDPDLGKWATQEEWPVWMGEARNVLGYPLGKNKGYCIHLYWPDSDLIHQSSPIEGWHDVERIDNVDLTGALAGIRRLLSKATNATRTKDVVRHIPEDWVDPSGRVVLVGQAAHPILPCCMHNQSLSVEDAVVLGELLTRLHRIEQLPQLLHAFQELREDRCQAVLEVELANNAMVSLPKGAAQENRDASMKNSLEITDEHWDDTLLSEQFHHIADVFGYHAREAAEDWWLQWGMLCDRNKGVNVHHALHTLDLRFEVTASHESDSEYSD